MTMRRWWIGTAVLALAMPAWAQKITVTTEVSPRRAYQGDTVILQVHIEGAAEPQPPDVPSTPDYDVQYYGGSRSTSSFSFSINGRTVRSSARTTFTYSLIPTRAGRITIPPVVLTHEGKQYRSAPTVLEVIKPQSQDVVFVELKADRQEAWIEQPVVVEVAVWLRRLELEGRSLEADPLLQRDPPELNIAWLDTLDGTETLSQQEFLPDYLARDQAGFGINGLTTRGGFFFDFDRKTATFMFPRAEATRTGLDGVEHDYYVYRFKKRYVPLNVGPLTFAPVRFKGELPVEVISRGRSLRVSRTERILSFSRPLVVNVKPVPVEGRPDSYCGAIGKVSLRAMAKPTEVHVGDPITLTMRLDGRARLESVGAPPLLSNKSLIRDFKIPEDPLGGVMEGNGKVFTQTIRARSESVAEIPPIEVSYFDPDRGEFRTVRSKPIPLTVHAASIVGTDDVIGFGDGPAATKLTMLSGGIQANYTDVGGLLASQQVVFSWKWISGPVAGPLAFLCIWFIKLRHDRLTGDVAYARRRKAYRHAMRKLNRVSSVDGAASIADAVAGCLLDYLADRCNRAGGSMTRQEATDVLRRAGVGEDRLSEFDRLLKSCELARYAHVDGSGDELVQAAQRCIKDIEKCRF